MSFKNKMKNRGISKLDNLVETPDYIEVKKPVKAKFNWLKIAIPVTASLVLFVLPVSIFLGFALGGVKYNAKGSGYSKDDSSSYPSDPDYYFDPSEESEAPGTAVSKDNSFADLLVQNNVKNNYVIEIYDYADGYMTPTYTFANEEAENIITSLNTIESDFNEYVTKINSSSIKRNESGYIMGINHKLVFKDGQNNKLVGHYFSQVSTLVFDQSAFKLSGSDAYTILDSQIEMDYDPNYDETIN